MTKKLNPPVAVCTDCRAYSRNVTSINEQCGNRYNGKRCKGVWGSAIGNNDWEECSTCHASGTDGNKKCDHCEGYGWIYIRPSV